LFYVDFSDTCEGLTYLEQNRIIHRDIAASNVLIADDNTAKISDFGLAKTIETIGNENGIIIEKIKCRTKWTAPEALESKVILVFFYRKKKDFILSYRDIHIKVICGLMVFFFGKFFLTVEVLILV